MPITREELPATARRPCSRRCIPRGLHARDLAVLDPEAGDGAVLDDVHAAPVGAPGVAPGHGVVARGAAALLEEAALDGKRAWSKLRNGYIRRTPRGRELGVGAVQDHGVAAPRVGVALGVGVEEVEDAALRHHGVVVELLLQPSQSFMENS
jgi:hypothetical protein